MNEKIDALLLSKIPYKERHLLGKVLLRNGRKASIIFYGGRGGGKYQKGTILEIGNMLSLEVKLGQRHSDLYNCSEWRSIWLHKNIRNNHKRFYLTCLLIEIAQMITTNADLCDPLWRDDNEDEGIFNVLSNAIFHTDNTSGSLRSSDGLTIFLTKLLCRQGLLPDLTRCILTGELLIHKEEVVLLPQEGGFASKKVTDSGDGHVGSALRNCLINYSKGAYQEILPIKGINSIHAKELFSYFCYQFNFTPGQFKSLAMAL